MIAISIPCTPKKYKPSGYGVQSKGVQRVFGTSKRYTSYPVPRTPYPFGVWGMARDTYVTNFFKEKKNKKVSFSGYWVLGTGYKVLGTEY